MAMHDGARNKVTRVLTRADLPAEPAPDRGMVAMRRDVAVATLELLEDLHRSGEAPAEVTVARAIESLRAALAAPEVAVFRPWDFDDTLTGNHIRIEVSPGYSRLQINNRHYYFYRETGEFDGTGTDFI